MIWVVRDMAGSRSQTVLTVGYLRVSRRHSRVLEEMDDRIKFDF